MRRLSEALADFALGPFRELLEGLDSVLRRGASSLLLVAAGLLAGWWIYVPLHELLHAFGCWAAGGEVSRLEISPLYGARWLSILFPFVTSGSAYAGRLSGFDTRGSDWIYLCTDLAPFALALFPGFWGLRQAARAARPIAFGASLPAAFAPLLSISGDAYEIGSLAVVHLSPWRGRRELIGDDLTAKVTELYRLAEPGLLGGTLLAATLGLLWALAWIFLARRLAASLGAPALARRVAGTGEPPRTG